LYGRVFAGAVPAVQKRTPVQSGRQVRRFSPSAGPAAGSSPVVWSTTLFP